MKKIANIVFYNFIEKNEEKTQVCIFYTNGDIEQVSYEDGLDIFMELAKERNISLEELTRMINNDTIHVVSGNTFEKDFDKFLVKNKATFSQYPNIINNSQDDDNNAYKNYSQVDEAFEDYYGAGENKSNYFNKADKIIDVEAAELPNNNDFLNSSEDNHEDENIIDVDDFNPKSKENDTDKDLGEYEDEQDEYEDFDDQDEYEDFDDQDEYEDEDSIDADDSIDYDIEDGFDYNNKNNQKKKNNKIAVETFDDSFDEEIEDTDLLKEEEEPKSKGLVGFLKRGIAKIKNSKLVRKIVIYATSIAAAFGLYSATSHLTKSGKMISSDLSDLNNNKAKEAHQNNDNDDNVFNNFSSKIILNNNDYYDNYSFDDLLAVTENETQYYSMSSAKETILNYNGAFANAYVENGKDVKAALTFEEIVALQHAYNDYDENEIKSYFNGTKINASNMQNDYKSASLQLMGAYVIETRDNPVNLEPLFTSEEALTFYNRYHEMFLSIKEATGEEKLQLAKEFSDAVREDFPINASERTEGIMHRDEIEKVSSYKLSVTPIIAAFETLYQNLEVDYTLSSDEINFLNDIGLCNYANDKFENIEAITRTAEEDKANPTFEQFSSAMANYLDIVDQAVIDDIHRDLSQLDSFKNAVNWHFETVNEADNSTSSENSNQTWTESQTTYSEEVKSEEKEIPSSEKEKIDKEIEAENAKAKEEGEKEAEQSQIQMQQEADKEAERVASEIAAEESKKQQSIDEVNKIINNNNSDTNTSNDVSINESDFGDNVVDFNDENENGSGKLNDSVENITTDGTGDMTGEKLPDPNKTGAEFDRQAENTTDATTQNFYEYEEELSDEEIVNNYIENLATQQDNSSESYQYTR